MPIKWWSQLNQALNDDETLDVLGQDWVDKYDLEMREGLAILQLLVMKKVPAALDGQWSPLLRKVAACKKVAPAIANFLMKPFEKSETLNDVKSLLTQHIAHITPSTLWLLDHDNFKKPKNQQVVRLTVTFCVYDRFDNDIDKLINMAGALKSPVGLMDAFLNAVIRMQVPLQFATFSSRYAVSLKNIKGTAELSLVSGQNLSQWPAILMRRNPIDLGLKSKEYRKKLISNNPDAAGIEERKLAESDGHLHQKPIRAFGNQMSVIELLVSMALLGKSTLMYVNWPCGLGKTTCMMELGHLLGVNSLPSAGKKTLSVKLVVPNTGLVKHYEKLFKDKQA